jgi:outer membrane lipoprotein carrier protein
MTAASAAIASAVRQPLSARRAFPAPRFSMRRTIPAALFAVTLAAAPATAQTPGDAALDRAVAAYAKVQSLRATFDQSLANPITGRSASAKGELLVKRPGRISVRFTEPAGDRIVSDGEYVWIYLPSGAPGQVIRTRADAAEGTGMDVSTELLTAPRAKFEIADNGAATVGGRATRIVSLTPRSPRNYSRARLWIDDKDGVVRQLELTENSGVVRTLTFRTIQLNAKIAASAFKFDVPKGAKVYDSE